MAVEEIQAEGIGESQEGGHTGSSDLEKDNSDQGEDVGVFD